jgi:hypothetical protein
MVGEAGDSLGCRKAAACLVGSDLIPFSECVMSSLTGA